MTIQKQSAQRQSGEGKHFFHVTPRKADGKWRVKEVGSKDEPRIFDTQDQATREAEKLAESVKGRVVMHDEHGKFKFVESF